jgi:two-component system, NarL family, invasion response regulator UvrY
MQQHSIFLVDDHTIVRNGLKELIEHMGNYQITGEFDNGKELVQKIPDSHPDVVIMDLTMPVMDGAATMRWMKDHNVDLPVLILTLDTSDKTIIDLYKLGVRGYLPKTCTAETLKRAIDDIIRTGYYHNELLSNAMRKDEAIPRKDSRAEILKKFTERELHFLQLVCDKEEYTYEQIADKMKVHRRTVDGYRESLFEKFNIKSKTGLVLFAIKHGLVAL